MKERNEWVQHAKLLGALLIVLALLSSCSPWQQRMHQGFSREDLRQFHDSIRTTNDEAGYRYRLGRHFQSRGDFALAAAEFRRAIAIDPIQPDNYTALGVCYDNLRQFELARACYRSALALRPEDAHARNNLGYSFLLQGDAESAIPELQQAVALNDKNTRFQNNLALALHLSGDLSAARQDSGGPAIALTADATGGTVPAPSRSAPVLEVKDPESSRVISAATIQIPETRAPAAENNPLAGRQAAQHRPPPAKSVQIEIRNGNGVYRMAANVGRYLKAAGFDVIAHRNADRFNYAATSIVYGNGGRQSAERLALQLFGPRYSDELLVNGYEDGKIKVVLGKDVEKINGMFNGSLPVVVANGNGRKGAARQFSRNLDAMGFSTGRPVDADHFGYAETLIIYPQGYQECARLLAAAVPGQAVKYRAGDSKALRIVIGRDT
jgi:tetratricopeptide (TPR) repeat protein